MSAVELAALQDRLSDCNTQITGVSAEISNTLTLSEADEGQARLKKPDGVHILKAWSLRGGKARALGFQDGAWSRRGPAAPAS